MFKYSQNICKHCLLQEDHYHNITINNEGICNLCIKGSAFKRLSWDELKDIFEKKIEKARGKNEYDGLIMLSGGKDSAYLSYILKKRYKLNLLGFIIDTNYEYHETFKNAVAIADALHLPCITYRQEPELMKEYYHFLLTEKSIIQDDAGQVCAFCGRFLIHTASSFADMMKIPLVFSGHNPDQIFLMGESIEIDTKRIAFRDYVLETFYDEQRKAQIVWRKKRGSKDIQRLFPKDLNTPDTELIFPLQYFPYKPQKMIETARRELNWTPIKQFSERYIASGCRLVNLWAYMASLNNTNNYVDFEFSNQVRDGVLDHDHVKEFKKASYNYEETKKLALEFGLTEVLKSLKNNKEQEDEGPLVYLDIKDILLNIVAECLNANKKDIDIYENIAQKINTFSFLLELTGKIETRFAMNNKTDNFLNYKNIHEMSLFIEQHIKERNVITKPQNSNVVIMKSSSNPKAMLFCLPYAGGMIKMIRKFCDHLPDDIDVSCALYPGVEGEKSPIETIEEITELYIDYLLSFENIPIYILGYCFGGYVAHHLVRVLAQRGLGVSGVIMVALTPPALKDKVYNIFFDDEKSVDNYISGGEELRKIYNHITDTMSEQELNRYWNLYWKSVKTILDYKVIRETIDTPALIVTGTDEEYNFLRAEDKSWLEFYPDSTFATVPGGHMLLVTNPKELACCIIENTGIKGSIKDA